MSKSPLIEAVKAKDQAEVERILAVSTADLGKGDVYGNTPLYYAVNSGYDTIVGVLVRYGADPNLQEIGGATPLHYAAFFNKPACLKTLLSGSKACQLEIRDGNGKTALDVARSQNSHACVALLEQYAADPTAFAQSGAKAAAAAAAAAVVAEQEQAAAAAASAATAAAAQAASEMALLVAQITAMGFTADQAKAALASSGKNVAAAIGTLVAAAPAAAPAPAQPGAVNFPEGAAPPASAPAGGVSGSAAAPAAPSGGASAASHSTSAVFASRVCEFDVDDDLDNINPIHGISSAVDMPIADACEEAKRFAEGLAEWDVAVSLYAGQKMAKKLAKKGLLDPLTTDEAVGLHIYTQESAFYKVLNASLRARDRSLVLPFFPYLKLVLGGLRKLPALDTTVYRGVKLNLAQKYPNDEDVIWWSFTSTTSTIEVMESKQFCGKSGDRTIFAVKVKNAVDITRYSAVGSENERLVFPGTPFTVTSSASLGAGLTMIQLEEDVDAPPLL